MRGELFAGIIVTFFSVGLSDARLVLRVKTPTTNTRKPFIRIFVI
jgi:hypothetical protein